MSDHYSSENYRRSPPENYERFFVPAIGEPAASDLMRVADLQPGERVLDVGTGTGIVARMAAERVGDPGSVDALDPNPGMLAVAKDSVREDLGVEWHQASAEKMPLPDEAYDVVLCGLSLQFVGDRHAAAREMHRVLAAGGRLVLNVPGRIAPMFEVMADAMGDHIGPEARGFVGHVFSLHDSDEIRGLLTDAGFQDVQVETEPRTLSLPSPKNFFWQYVWSTPLSETISQADEETQAALERDVVDGWRKFERDGGMDYEQEIITAKARK